MQDCRLCLETDFPEKMISPCACKGSAKYVHEDCLLAWLDRKGDPIREKIAIGAEGDLGISCEICKHEYKGKKGFSGLFDLLKTVLFSDITINVILSILGFKLCWLGASKWVLDLLKAKSKVQTFQAVGISISKIFAYANYGLRVIGSFGVLPSYASLAYNLSEWTLQGPVKSIISRCKTFRFASLN